MRIRGFFYTWETRWNRKAFLKAPPHKRSAEDQLIPGGYVEFGETPGETLTREFQEETGVTVKAGKLFGMRFSAKDWYAVFEAEYVEGEARSDGDENDKVVWMDIEKALADETVPDLTKKMIRCAVSGEGFGLIPYESKTPGRNLYSLLQD